MLRGPKMLASLLVLPCASRNEGIDAHLLKANVREGYQVIIKTDSRTENNQHYIA